MEIYKSTNYDQFKIILSNREVDKNHVRRLARSIKKKNLLFVRPLIVDGKLQVIDGQHRLEACRQSNEPVYYIKCEGLTKQDIAVLNTAQKNWTRLDFINFYAIEGRKEFKELSKIINKFPQLKVSMILKAYGECGRIREGIIGSVNADRARTLCAWLTSLIEEGYRFAAEIDCGLAIKELIKSESQFQKFSDRKTPESFFKCHSVQEYKQLISNILSTWNQN